MTWSFWNKFLHAMAALLGRARLPLFEAGLALDGGAGAHPGPISALELDRGAGARGKSPGRAKGFHPKPAQRHPVIYKTSKKQKKTKRLPRSELGLPVLFI
jgi:hypothetical protein